MRILIDISHPAHVHFFKSAIRKFIKHGHLVKVVSRDKDLAINLLDLEGIEHSTISVAPQRNNIMSLANEMLVHCVNLYRISKSFKPDVMLQIAGTFIAPVGSLLRCHTVVFYDTEFAKISNMISYPLASCVCTPDCYEGRVRGKHIRYPGYHELAYLHPDEFSPNKSFLTENNIDSGEKLFIVRFVGWGALHDVKEKGLNLNYKIELVKMLSNYGRVFISSESQLPRQLEEFRSNVPIHKMHDIMSFATLVVGESATMASEAAVLGIPAIFISTTPRGYTNEQEYRYGLVKNFSSSQQVECLRVAENIASQPISDLKRKYRKKRKTMLEQKINVSRWITEFVEGEKFKY